MSEVAAVDNQRHRPISGSGMSAQAARSRPVEERVRAIGGEDWSGKCAGSMWEGECSVWDDCEDVDGKGCEEETGLARELFAALHPQRSLAQL